MNCPEEVSFNVKDGFLDATLRGFRSGLISANEYRNLGQCDSLDDLKLQLVTNHIEQTLLACRFTLTILLSFSVTPTLNPSL